MTFYNKRKLSFNLLPAYRILLRSAWSTSFRYRARIVLLLLTMLFPFVTMSIWLSIVGENGPIAGWDRNDFIAYYIGTAVVYRFTYTWWTVAYWDTQIRNGELSAKLLKPLDPFHFVLAEELGWRLLDLIMLLLISLIIILAIPSMHSLLSLEHGLLFLASLVTSFTLSILMTCTYGMIAFWSTQSQSIYALSSGIGQFLSGYIAPLSLFPLLFQRAAFLMPFRSTLGFPVEILTGKLTSSEIVSGFTVTVIWISVFLLLYRVLWHLGIKRYEASGA